MSSISAEKITVDESPVLIFGGSYSNLEATQAMKDKADELAIPPERIICTGDLVAYCASPIETIDLIRAWSIHVVMGNCEESLANSTLDCGCGFEAGTSCAVLSDQWFRYTDNLISDEHRSWMGSLPRQLRFNLKGRSIAVVHGAPSQINRFIFESTDDLEKQRELTRAEADIVVGGHCGIPFGQKHGERTWLNSGVIGMPANDGTPLGWYLLLQDKPEGLNASWHTLNYDFELAISRMKKSGLDNGYAKALSTGLWPSMDVLPESEKDQQGISLHPRTLIL